MANWEFRIRDQRKACTESPDVKQKKEIITKSHRLTEAQKVSLIEFLVGLESGNYLKRSEIEVPEFLPKTRNIKIPGFWTRRRYNNIASSLIVALLTLESVNSREMMANWRFWIRDHRKAITESPDFRQQNEIITESHRLNAAQKVFINWGLGKSRFRKLSKKKSEIEVPGFCDPKKCNFKIPRFWKEQRRNNKASSLILGLRTLESGNSQKIMVSWEFRIRDQRKSTTESLDFRQKKEITTESHRLN